MPTPKIRVGPAGWSYRDWAGVVYPKPRSRDFHEASYLAGYFDTVELNTTFYAPASPEAARDWAQRVSHNPGFLFTAKLWHEFTHQGDLSESNERAFRPGIETLRDAGKLGALLAQFPFSFKETPESRQFLSKLIERFSDFPLVIEVRHRSWDKPEFYVWLAERGAGFCNIDQPIIGRSLPPTSRTTAPVGYVRMHGRRYDTWFSDDPETPLEERYNYLYSIQELEPWKERIQTISANAAATFAVANNHFRGKAIVNALQLLHLLRRQRVAVPPPLLKHYPELESIASTKEVNLPLFSRDS